MSTYSRRELFELLVAGAMTTFALGYTLPSFGGSDSNFRHIYLNPELRAQFFLFLKNIFHLYPESDFDAVINNATLNHLSDHEIYEAILKALPSIRPVLKDVRYALPSLKKQKEIMCKQTLSLLDGKKNFAGYLEIGSTGRYFDKLQDSIDVASKPIFINTSAPTYGAADIIERGQIRKMGSYLPLQDYIPISATAVPDETIDLLCVYIGFHHSPPDARDAFIASCYRVLQKGGALIVRDHDVASNDMMHFVALAHDVFNAGLELPWQNNESEVRNFLSLAELEKVLIKIGFQPDDRRLLQDGDPTKNTLMKFIKA